jgi:hypothetical protein
MEYGVMAALWVEDATSAYEDNETWCSFFMEPTVEKDEHGEVVRSGIYIPRRNRSYILWNVKTTMVFLEDIKNKSITIQNQPD